MGGNKRQLVLDALNNKSAERVPYGFWYHFAEGKDLFRGLEDPAIVERNIRGHRKLFRDAEPDFMKLMSDGFFGYPDAALEKAVSARDLRSFRPVGKGHPWAERQVELCRALTEEFGSEVLTFYTVFSPATVLKFLWGDGDRGNRALADRILEDPEAAKHALDSLAEDLASLAERVITEGGADGIYLSVQSVQDPRITGESYRSVIAPSELRVLDAANQAGGNSILHICGYDGIRNDLSLFADYDAKAVNWAVTTENVSLREGKKLFGGKAVIGGFANGKKGLLYSGSEEDVRGWTKKLVAESGETGVLIGADCTIPSDIGTERFRWIRESAN